MNDPLATSDILLTSDENRVRTLTLNRPESLNAFTEALYDAVTIAVTAAADDESVSVLLLTGAGRAFSAGNDLRDMQARFSDPEYQPGVHGFEGMIAALVDFPKPFICAVNGIGVGVGTTILGHADLVFMSSEAKLQCPFTKLGVAPEAGSSYLMPQLLGRQNAAWLLMSSEWMDAADALRMGVVWKVCAPGELMTIAMQHADVLAAKPVASLMAVKQTMVAPLRPLIEQAVAREVAEFSGLLGGAANAEALAAFHGRRR
jgi:enoyl-CoA hydratase/carnithine racemase